MRRSRPGILLFLLIAAAQFAWYSLVVRQQIATPSILRDVDYVAIYPAGYIAHYQGIARAYDLDLQKQVEAAVSGLAASVRFYPYNHPPFLLRILQWVTTSDYTASFYRWTAVLIVFHLLSLLVMWCLLHSLGWRRVEVWLAVVTGLFFYPIFASYLKGQDSVFILLGILLWAYGLQAEKDGWAGLGLVLAGIRPQVALALALPFIFKRRRVWWGFLGWGLVALFYFFLLIGLQGLKDFFQTLLLSSTGMGLDVKAMPTLMGALIRTFPGISATTLHIVGYGAWGLAILALCLFWLKSRQIRLEYAALAVLVSLFFAPHLHMHDLSLLLLPALAAAVHLAKEKVLRPDSAVFVVMGVSLIFVVNGILLSYTITYLVMILLGVLLFIPHGWMRRTREAATE